jgi:hypothetical protein
VIETAAEAEAGVTSSLRHSDWESFSFMKRRNTESAKMGILAQVIGIKTLLDWIPACAGMTNLSCRLS